MAPAALPSELVNLLALHSSFLTALSLHYAHNGTATPVDLRSLTQSISAVWKKRKVTLEDIRLCVGVLSAGPSGINNPFFLSDYTGGKICLEIRPEHKQACNLGPLNEEALQSMFMQSLDDLWRTWNTSQGSRTTLTARPIATPRRRGRPRKADTTQKSMEVFVVDDNALAKFISQLPLAEITLCPAVAASAPIREKGRKRLRELKESAYQGRMQKKLRESTGKENEDPIAQTQTQATQPKITEFAAVRKSNLLDRILAKQAAKAAAPAPLSPAELQRQAALQRSEEVLGVLSLLAAGKGPGSRVSFSMSTLLQSLQSSIRSPLSKEETLRCVEVLANEVAPGYVSIVRMGAISSVVINQLARPVDVKRRLAALGVA
ncbi:uncharacterized protein EI97DRAFT_434223 [Westerdykella ornata]|uniref:DNA replication factor Cdt1 C-terminal domain-containing protein n=1 Tax=Westerdykella ornata TaxID=318751 RepID=A0A6A6JFP4_WESOR|nr:uncharacterized protein EI97DRAFT_434223 [Westerdykella ornata]KAF2275371.1 hypothetical protein EI97DRAFT_434223 [Westerdykella ornata]